MNLETERKFLVKDDSYKKDAVKSYRISQGYIAREEGNTVRVRIRNDKGFLTIKGRTTENGLSRPEWEREIPLEDATSTNGLFANAQSKPHVLKACSRMAVKS